MVLANRIAGPGMVDAVAAVRSGRSAIDAVEAGIRPIETDPSIRSVGVGGWTNLLGEVELDAAVMDGRSLRSGGVGSLRGFTHPISVARSVMEQLPHVLLVGEGAALFAAECGAESGPTLTDEARREWQSWIDRHVPDDIQEGWPDTPLAPWSRLAADPETARGTTCFLVIDANGDIAAGVSTCGWAFKYPGRLGDSPIVGAGLFADNRYGAAACTGQGELALRSCTSRSIVQYMKSGLTVVDACSEAISDLRRLERDFGGGLALHAIDGDGNHCVRTIGIDRKIGYWRWQDGMESAAEATALQEPW